MAALNKPYFMFENKGRCNLVYKKGENATTKEGSRLPIKISHKDFEGLEAVLVVDSQGVRGYECFLGNLMVAQLWQRTLYDNEVKELNWSWCLLTMEGTVPFKHVFAAPCEAFEALYQLLKNKE